MDIIKDLFSISGTVFFSKNDEKKILSNLSARNKSDFFKSIE